MREHVTKQYVSLAFFEFLKEKPFEAIKVSDVVKKAGISRASFYRNYLDLDEIIEEYLEQFFTVKISFTDIRDLVYQTLSLYYQNQDILLLLYKRKLLDRFDHVMYENVLKEIQERKVFNNKYQPYFFSGAAIGFIRGWIENSFEETPEVMSDLFIQSLKGYMKVD